jgi:hypothetical protein
MKYTFLRILEIDLLNITVSPYTNFFDALLADWSLDDEDNLEQFVVTSFSYMERLENRTFGILVTQPQLGDSSLLVSITSILNDDYGGFYAW